MSDSVRFDLVARDVDASVKIDALILKIRALTAEQERLRATTFNTFSRAAVAPQIEAFEQLKEKARGLVTQLQLLSSTVPNDRLLRGVIDSAVGLDQAVKSAAGSARVLGSSLSVLAAEDSKVRDANIAAAAAMRRRTEETRIAREEEEKLVMARATAAAAAVAAADRVSTRTARSAARTAAEPDANKIAREAMDLEQAIAGFKKGDPWADILRQQLQKLTTQFDALTEASMRGGKALEGEAAAQFLSIRNKQLHAEVNEKLKSDAGLYYLEVKKNEAAEKAAAEAVDKARASIANKSRALTSSAGAFGTATSGASRFNQEIKHTVAAVDEVFRGQRGQLFATLGAALRDAGFGGGAIIGGLGALVGTGIAIRLGEMAGRMGELVEQTINSAAAAGISTQQFQLLDRELELAGGGAKTLTAVFGTMSQRMEQALSNPLSNAASAFLQLGFGQEELRKGLEDLPSFLDALRDRFSTMGDTMLRTELFRAALGQGFQRLIPFLRQSTTDIQKYKEEVEKSGTVLDDLSKKQLSEAAEKTHELSINVDGLGFSFARLASGTGVITMIKDYVQWVRQGIDNVNDLIEAQKSLPEVSEKVRERLSRPYIYKGFQEQQEDIEKRRLRGRGAADLPASEFSGVTDLRTGLSVSQLADMVMQTESGFKNVLARENPRTGGRGYAQFVDSTWRSRANEFGVDTSLYPRAIDAPYDIQRRVTEGTIARHGLGDWLPWNANLRAMLGTGAAGRRVSDFTSQDYSARANIGEAPIGGVSPQQRAILSPVYDQQALERELTHNLDILHRATRLREAQYEKEIAAAQKNLTGIEAITQRKAQYTRAQVDEELKIRQDYANRVVELAPLEKKDEAREAAARMLDLSNMQREATVAESQDLRAQEAVRREQVTAKINGLRAAIAETDNIQKQIEYTREIAALEATLNEKAQGKVIIAEAEKRARQEQVQILEEQLATISHINQVAERTMGQKRDFRSEIALINETYNSEKKILDQIMEVANQTDNTRLKTHVWNLELDKAVERSEKIEQVTKKLADAWGKPFKEGFDKISQGFEGALTSLLDRSKTLQQIWADIGKSFLSAGISVVGGVASRVAGGLLGGKEGQGLGEVISDKIGSFITKQIGNFAGDALSKTVSSAAGGTVAATEMTAAMTAGGVTAGAEITAAMAAGGAAAAAEISAAMAAGGAAGGALGGAAKLAGTAASLALAPATGGLSLFGMKLFEHGGIASAAGGMIWDGKGGQLGIFHPEEMTLPAPLSRGLQNKILQPQQPQPAPQVTNLQVPVAPGGTFLDGASFQRMFHQYGGKQMIVDAVRAALNGNSPALSFRG